MRKIKKALTKLKSKAKEIYQRQKEEREKESKVRKALAEKELEKEAKSIAKKAGVSLEEAKTYVKAERKRKKRAETLKKLSEIGESFGEGTERKKKKSKAWLDIDTIASIDREISGIDREIFGAPAQKRKKKEKEALKINDII